MGSTPGASKPGPPGTPLRYRLARMPAWICREGAGQRPRERRQRAGFVAAAGCAAAVSDCAAAADCKRDGELAPRCRRAARAACRLHRRRTSSWDRTTRHTRISSIRPKKSWLHSEGALRGSRCWHSASWRRSAPCRRGGQKAPLSAGHCQCCSSSSQPPPAVLLLGGGGRDVTDAADVRVETAALAAGSQGQAAQAAPQCEQVAATAAGAPSALAQRSCPAAHQSCSRPNTSVPPGGSFLPRPRTTDQTCSRARAGRQAGKGKLGRRDSGHSPSGECMCMHGMAKHSAGRRCSGCVGQRHSAAAPAACPAAAELRQPAAGTLQKTTRDRWQPQGRASRRALPINTHHTKPAVFFCTGGRAAGLMDQRPAGGPTRPALLAAFRDCSPLPPLPCHTSRPLSYSLVWPSLDCQVTVMWCQRPSVAATPLRGAGRGGRAGRQQLFLAGEWSAMGARQRKRRQPPARCPAVQAAKRAARAGAAGRPAQALGKRPHLRWSARPPSSSMTETPHEL